MIDQTHPVAAQLIDTAIESATQLYQLLTQESELLKAKQHKQSYKKLDALTLQKNVVIEKLNTFSRQVEQILLSAELTKEDGMEKYFAAAQTAGVDTSVSHKHWQQFTQLTMQCRTLNESNGACLYMLNKQSVRILDVLKGKDTSISTYTKNGHTKSSTFSTPIISV